MTFEKVVVIDARGHLCGRLASVVAKELLSGQKVVVVRAEGLELSGSMIRNKMTFARYKKKRMNSNPARGPYHQRAPARMFHRMLRGMIPHKTKRGEAAMERVKIFEGVPQPYDKMKRMVVPDALRVLRLAPRRKYIVLGDLASQFGWKCADIVNTLEDKRREKAEVYFADKKKTIANRAQAIKNKESELASVNESLAQYGF
ncbi:60S ribosomal protein L13a [Sphaeroforma arctica JP610]|uniref:60S ribosomal protein L13a n=1 Tax=Sphaeroforma arctica JP610 TaxID=667725 RepID=A0A0L0FIG6_9EUKA|nr:60S ribosomal protein L13a [Sphaeroforma arctica JP610]KNC76550.1 60S ribosomal protein L13a [Sphaeroforma arctica JP610]|eukprot:XP_014150452.1 60S ribosomal protein L13a [Sphaeroforma arctica JP610]